MHSIKDQDPPKALFLCFSDLPDSPRRGTIFSAVTLSKWRHGWRIKHPQAATVQGKFASYPETSATAPEVYPVSGHGSGAKENAPAAPFLVRALLCGYPIRLVLIKYKEITPMIYTFLIQRSRACRVVELSRIRTISAFGQNEAQARSALAGLPLVFLSRTPSKGVAA